MTALALTCRCCDSALSVPLDALLLAVVDDDQSASRLAYICPSCGEFACDTVSLASLMMLMAAGCLGMHVSCRQPHPEKPPSGPLLTLDDLIDLHNWLASDDWVAVLAEKP